MADIKKLEYVLKALANKRRLAIVKFLRGHEEAVVGEIADHIGLSFKATSRHLAILATAEVLSSEQRSTFVYYRLASTLPRVAKDIITLL